MYMQTCPMDDRLGLVLLEKTGLGVTRVKAQKSDRRRPDFLGRYATELL